MKPVRVQPQMKEKYSLWYVKILSIGIGLIMVIAPFYAPLTVWLASHLQHFDFWKIWKEFALTGMGAVLLTFLLTHRRFARRVLHSRLALVMSAYLLLIIGTGVYDLLTHRVSDNAVIYGLLVDVRPIGFFALTFLTFAMGLQKTRFSFPWRRVVLVPALLVIAFGFLQFTVLPKDVLSHIGYSKSTIAPYQTVDNQPDIVRIESTLRGANPLGAYLVLIIPLLVTMIFVDRKRQLLWIAATAAALAVMFGTYSRSAELGLVLALISLFAIYERRFIGRHILAVAAAGVVVVIVGALAAGRGNYFAQNVFFHSSSSSTSSVSSNQQRLEALKNGARDVVHQPLGAGVGSAGPASLRNSKSPGRIAENYFLQIGQEIGVLGMALFIAINLMIAKGLWRMRRNQLAQVLLASLVGLTFVNLLSHAWTDDTLAYIWWGLAGIALAPAILEAKSKRDGKSRLSKTA